MNRKQILNGLLGLCIGDALGVPVEFLSRDKLKVNPVTDMLSNGSHNQPKGTWSDDSSMTFCLTESLCSGYDVNDIADKFYKWLIENYWTPHGKTFGIGQTTFKTVGKYKNSANPLKCGMKTERSNGNGSLMRTLPLAFLFV